MAVRMQTQPSRHSGFKSFVHLNLGPLRKALKSFRSIASSNGSTRSESISTVDFSICLSGNQLDNKGGFSHMKAENLTTLPVTSMTFAKVVDIFEELETPQEIIKQARRTRHSSFTKRKLNKKKSSRPNTAVDAIMYSGFNPSNLKTTFEPKPKARNSSHLLAARTKLLFQKQSSQSSPLRVREPNARETRLKYRVYNPPLDCFELQRRLKAYHDQNSVGFPHHDSSYGFAKANLNHRPASAPAGYKHRVNPRVPNLETIPEAVGAWVVLKDPKRRTKLDYVLTSW